MGNTWMVLVPALLASVFAFAAAALLRRHGVLRLEPQRYVPHLVFLCTLAAAPMLAHGEAGTLRAASVFAGVGVVWLVALLLLSRSRV